MIIFMIFSHGFNRIDARSFCIFILFTKIIHLFNVILYILNVILHIFYLYFIHSFNKSIRISNKFISI